MAKTVIGLMDSLDGAQRAVRALAESGIPRSDIGFMANERHALPSTAALNEAEGGDGADDALLARRGGILVTVAADRTEVAETAVAVLRRQGALDVDERP